jgi:Ca-activated chloride channel family protein
MNPSNTEKRPAQLNLKVTPRRPALLTGFDNTIDFLVQIEGPEEPIEKPRRAALNLALVLDRSGSMSGTPLAEAVRCAQFIIENLNDSDRAALVVYDDNVNVLVPNSPLQNKAKFLDALKTIHSGGNTNLHSGWLQGAQEAARFVAPNRVSRVLLLSDGQANQGLTDLEAITKQCEQLAETGVSTSTYGLSYHFNEELMSRMAKEGGGNAYYGESADDLIEPFQREFDLLSALFAKQVYLHIQPRSGIEVSVLNPYLNKNGAFILPDVAYGGVAWAIVRLKIPAELTGVGDGAQQSLFEVMVSANDMDGQPLELSSIAMELPSLPTQAWHSVSEDESVCRRTGELEAAVIQDAARLAARKGDWSTVRQLLEDARLKAPNNPWVNTVIETLEALAKQQDSVRFSKEALYSSQSMSSRLYAIHESADYNPEMENASLSYLKRKPKQGKKDPIATSQSEIIKNIATSPISDVQASSDLPKAIRASKWLNVTRFWNRLKGQ